MNKSIIPDTTGNEPSTSAQVDRPAWADPRFDAHDGSQHPDDRGIYYRSAPVDEWTVVHEQDGKTFAAEATVRVLVSGFRHTVRPDFDWPDSILVEGHTDPGGDSNLMLPDTARRLAAALIKAADTIDRHPQADRPTRRESCDRGPCDAALQRRTHRAGEHAVNWMRASEIGVEVAAVAYYDDPWYTLVATGGEAVALREPEAVRLVSALLNANETASDANLADAEGGDHR